MAAGPMNYIGTISILERAAAPAQAVLDRTARTRAQRHAEETREELTKVMSRVENIYGNFELDNVIFESKYSGMEYLDDLEKLEELLHDQVKKKKYQQQITIFVVGFQDASDQKLRLLKQVNEFFMENTKKMEEEEEQRDTPSNSPDTDLDNVHETIEDTLRTTEDLMQRLGDLHQEVVNSMHNYVQARTGNKAKKKLEKTLAQSKDDINHLNEKLLNLQKEIEERDGKIQQLAKLAEMRNLEINKYKKSNQDTDKWQEEVKRRDEKIRELQRQIGQLQIDLGQEEHSNQMANSRLTDTQQDGNMKVEQLQRALEERNIEMEEAKRRLHRQYEGQLDDLQEIHKQEMDKLKKQHAEEQKKMTESSQKKADSKAANKKLESRKSQNKTTKKSGPRESKEFINESNEDGTLQDNATTLLPPQVPEGSNWDFDDEFPIDDEESWASVPPEDVYGRFAQFRRMAREVIADLSDQVEETVRRTSRKIDIIKEQFQDHKTRWEEEKETLLKQRSEALQLQQVAEEEASQALAQMEGYIAQGDILDEEEKAKTEALTDAQTEALTETQTDKEAEDKAVSTTDTDVEDKPTSSQPDAEDPHAADAAGVTPEEAEMQRKLLDMTDDAKVLSRQQRRASSNQESELKDSIKGETVDEIKESSAKSRKVLRDQHRNSLAAIKADAEGRLSRSSGSSLSQRSTQSAKSRSQRSTQSAESFGDLKAVESAGADLRKGDCQDIGTSPFSSNSMMGTNQAQDSVSMVNHPLMGKFMATYEGIMNFKENLSQVFMDKEMTSACEELEELQMISFNEDEEVEPQLEQMTSLAYQILEKCVNLLDSLLGENRDDYNVSVMETQDSAKVETMVDSKPTSSKSDRASSDSLKRELQLQLQDLQAQYLMLQRQFDENTKKYEGQVQRKTKTMMEMQDTINSLRHEVSNLKKQLAAKPEPVSLMDSPLMFTRMDSERNAKILKRAVNERRISHDKYVEAVKTMDSYVNLPAKRLAHLVRKYVHHKNMKNTEKNLQNSRHLFHPRVAGTLDKMEAFDAARAQKWGDQMDAMGAERLELAASLMSTLDDIEQESGIFLIKPFYSYKGSAETSHQKFQGKLSRRPPYREQVTPASHVRTIQQLQGRPNSRQNDNQASVAGKASHIETAQSLPVWMPGISHTMDDLFDTQVEVPKIMELDVNRMLIPQNQISMKVTPSAVTDDRLANAANASVRSYIAVNRPTKLPQSPLQPILPETKEVKPPPVTRESSFINNQKSSSNVEIPPALPSTPPLPPITSPSVPAAPAEKVYEAPFPPASPPGSSIRQTPSTRHSAKFSQLSDAEGQHR